MLPSSRDEAIGVASTSNPDVISAQFTQEAAEDNIRLVRGQLLPTVTLTGTARAGHQSEHQGDPLRCHGGDGSGVGAAV